MLLVRLSALGDVVHALWALSAVRHALPRCRIGFAVEDAAATMLRDHPHIDRLHVLPRGAWKRGLRSGALSLAGLGWEASRFVRELRAARYEVAIDLQGNLRSGLVTRSSGAPRRIGPGRGHGKEGNHLVMTEGVALPAGPLHRVERGLALVAALGIDVGSAQAPPPRPAIADPPEHAATAAAFVAELRAGDARRPVVAIHPGVSGFGAFKAWREAGYVAFARRARRERGAAVVVTWGPGERELAERVAQAIAADPAAPAGAPPARPCYQTRSVLDLAALLRRVDLVVAADTGPLHLAAVLGTPVVGLYGAKDPQVYGPWGTSHRVVMKGVPCSPCSQRRCVRPDCMNLITAGEVGAAAGALLAEGAA